MKKINFKTMINVTIVAALYVALTLLLAPLSYNAVQFRLSEALIILVCYNPIYAISLSVGCLVSNLASPMGIYDVIFGTLATIIAVIPMIFVKNKPLASLFPSISNAIIIGLELHFLYELPFWLSAFQVFIGEFVVVSVVGLATFKSIEKHRYITEGLNLYRIDEKESKLDKILKPELLINFALMVMGLVLFFNLGMHSDSFEDGSNNNYLFTLSSYVFDKERGYNDILFIIHMIIPILLLGCCMIKNRLAKLIIKFVLAILGIGFLIYAIIRCEVSVSFYFYLYFFYYFVVLFVGYLSYTLSKNQIYELKEEL